MVYEPNFLLTFEINEPYEDFLEWLQHYYKDLNWIRPEFAMTSENYIDIETNTLYDPRRIEEDDGHIHYRYVIFVLYMVGGDIDEAIMKKQAKLARRFIIGFTERGYQIVLDSPSVEKFI